MSATIFLICTFTLCGTCLTNQVVDTDHIATSVNPATNESLNGQYVAELSWIKVV